VARGTATGARAALLKPSAIYGTRYAATAVGLVPIPLGLVLAPAI
jgi:hypothetical protein